MPAQDPTTVKLLTLLNVSSLRSTRRSLKAKNEQNGDASKRRKLGGKLLAAIQPQTIETEEDEMSEVESDEEDARSDHGELISISFIWTSPDRPIAASSSGSDGHSLHFGTSQESAPAILTKESRTAIDSNNLVSKRLDLGAGPDGLGSVVSLQLEGGESEMVRKFYISRQMIYPHSNQIRHPQLYLPCFPVIEMFCSHMLERRPKNTTTLDEKFATTLFNISRGSSHSLPHRSVLK